MTNYLLVYKGGEAPENESDREAVMAAWGAWFAELGEAVVDGGNPFAQSSSVAADGSVAEGAASALTGYSILSAESLPEAVELAQACPVRGGGGGHLGGLYLFQADELEAATEIAARIPAARFGRAIEVRPLVEHESVAEQVFRHVWVPSTRARSDNSKQALSLQAFPLRFG